MTKSNINGTVVQNAISTKYALRDQLGNTRVTFTDGVNYGMEVPDPNGGPSAVGVDPSYDDGVVTQEDIMQINHFYPFGLNMEGDWNGAQGKNKYQYNGKEWNDDFGLGWNHHDWRFYDVAIGRFITIDPESEKDGQMSYNPYHFALDNPIRYNDPDGRNPIVRALARLLLRRAFVQSIVAPKPPPLAVRSGMQELVRRPTLTGKVDNTRVLPNRVIPLKNIVKSEEKKPEGYTVDRELPRDKNGNPQPEQDAEGAHTQLGTREGRKGTYKKAREFDENGNPVKDIEFTDHGRPQNHPNPHQHRYLPNKTGGTPQHGKAEPLD